MEHDGSLGRMLRFCEWIMRFAYTNLLWLFFYVARSRRVWHHARDRGFIRCHAEVDPGAGQRSGAQNVLAGIQG